MNDPRDLRSQARQWRRQALFQTPQIAASLVLAARQLEEQADGIEQASSGRPPDGYPRHPTLRPA